MLSLHLLLECVGWLRREVLLQREFSVLVNPQAQREKHADFDGLSGLGLRSEADHQKQRQQTAKNLFIDAIKSVSQTVAKGAGLASTTGPIFLPCVQGCGSVHLLATRRFRDLQCGQASSRGDTPLFSQLLIGRN
jgi:hypothetical protein